MPLYSRSLVAGLALLAACTLSDKCTAQSCVTPVDGLSAWWAGENSLNDNAGNLPASLEGSISYGPGQVGIGFLFPGETPGLRVPANPSIDVGLGEGFTLELWIKPVSGEASYPLLEWSDTTAYGVHFWIASRLYANLVDTNGGSHIVETTNGLVKSDIFQHVAVSYNYAAGRIRLYHNGSIINESSTTPFVPKTSSDLLIGFRAAGIPFGPAYFSGTIDEPAIYSRELTPAEIADIHAAGAAGKCFMDGPAVLLVPPATNYVGWTGANLAIKVVGGGALPLSYQWYYEGQPIPDATSSTLSFPSAALEQTGVYTIVVSNNLGFSSAETVVTIKASPVCTQPPTGLISLWRGDYDAQDSVGKNHGDSVGTLAYAEGKVGSCFVFNGTGNWLTISDAPCLNPQKALSLECWVNPAELGTGTSGIIAKDAGGFLQPFGFSMAQQDSQSFFRAVIQNGSEATWLTWSNAVNTNTWYHLALTYDGTDAVFFVDGHAVSQVAMSGDIVKNNRDLLIGRGSQMGVWKGMIDDVALYGRALSAQEILQQYLADAGGKCRVAVPPFIIGHPANARVLQGKSFSSSVVACGSEPLFYQWLKEGVPIPDATNQVFQKVFQLSDTGTYSVVISNSAGSVTSDAASFTVAGPPTISMTSTSVPVGSVLVLPVKLVTFAGEIACSFSIQFDPLRFKFLDTDVQASDGAVLMVNRSLSGSGRLGFTVAASGDKTLGLATNIINISLLATNILTTSTISFSDYPTARQAVYSDFQLGTLASSPSVMVLILNTNLEADVFPATPDRSLTAADWLRAGRYIAGLDVPASEGVFQALDCAPRDSKGDGRLGVADWVQAYRYVFGHDLSTGVSGPLKAEPPLLSTETNRQIRVHGVNLPPLGEVDLPITLLATGDENAIGFTLSFDPTTARLVSASPGTDATGGYSLLNTNQLSEGKLGVLLALPAETRVASGERQVFTVRLKNTRTTAVILQPQFTSLPALTEASSWEGLPLPLIRVSIPAPQLTPPQLQIERFEHALHLTWPASASDYVLQESWSLYSADYWTNSAHSPELSGASFKVVLPQTPTGNTRFFRLHQR